MAQFIPESSLLDHIYVPFYRPPIKRVENCSNFFTYLEPDANGVVSIINLRTDTAEGGTTPVVPFIDIGKFDPETKDWAWIDASGFPYRITQSSVDVSGWALKPLWPINHVNEELQFDPTDLTYSEEGKELGFYSSATIDSSTVRIYSSNPVMLTIEGKIIQDKTVYGSENITTGLTELNTELNPEFYYDSINNKIYTNQNLLGVDPSNIKVYFYESANEVSVKARMATNAGGPAYYTPIVDYYIVKLNGQFLRG